MLSYDAVIIGAGISGAMTARELSKFKLKICILEAQSDVAMGTTKANSAIVHAGFDAKEGSLKAKFNVQGSEMYEQLCSELGVKYKRTGALVTGFCPEDLETLKNLKKRGETNGVKELRLITERSELEKLEPGLAKNVCCALYAPTSAITNPFELCIAAVGNAMDNGAELKLNYEVSSILPDDSGYIINNEIKARCVVNAAGLYSDRIAGLIGDDSFTITPRKGEYILLDKDGAKGIEHTLFRCPGPMGKGILLSPAVGGYICGPTAEDIQDKEDLSTTAEGLEKVKEGAELLAANVDWRKRLTVFAGLRSVSQTGDFIINSPKSGFYNIAGIESPGLSAAPAIGRYVAEQIAAYTSAGQNESFNPFRPSCKTFKMMESTEEKNEIIKNDPAYGHIICRCKKVSEGEIRAAIRMNPRPHDLDGLKRRTHAQMGRCQGGFCTPYLVTILAEELGITPEEVTKNGGSSCILTGKTKSWS